MICRKRRIRRHYATLRSGDITNDVAHSELIKSMSSKTSFTIPPAARIDLIVFRQSRMIDGFGLGAAACASAQLSSAAN